MGRKWVQWTRLAKHFTFPDRIDTHDNDDKFSHTPYLKEWMVDYTMSYLHAIHLWSTNKNLLTFLEKYSKVVKFFAFDCHGDLEGKDAKTSHPYNIMAHDFIEDYFLMPKIMDQPNIKFCF